VRVDIYDLRGRHVTELFAGELPAGARSFSWDGHGADGERVPIGIYFSRVAMDDRVITRRLVLLPR
jgi:flagellar hook assembly protein FlgD